MIAEKAAQLILATPTRSVSPEEKLLTAPHL
jgi:hypothetical protein